VEGRKKKAPKKQGTYHGITKSLDLSFLLIEPLVVNPNTMIASPLFLLLKPLQVLFLLPVDLPYSPIVVCRSVFKNCSYKRVSLENK
jgi:hypothetical protein